MPKLKTKSSVKKRFRLTGTGKVRMNQSGKQHGMIKRTNKHIRNQRGTIKKAILRPLAKVRVDLDDEGGITPVLLRLEAEGEPIVVARVERVDDRLAEVWYEVLTREGDRLTLRLVRDGLRFTLHTVETDHPERWRGWSEDA